MLSTDRLDLIARSLHSGALLKKEDALYLYNEVALDDLLALAHSITQKFASAQISMCSITNIKSGRCSEDCKWCAQSQHFKTAVAEYDIKDKETVLQEARWCYEHGIQMFSLVASGRKQNKKDFLKLLDVIDYLRQNVPIALCVSLGLSDVDQMKALRQHGVERYHCNLESGPEYFKSLCTRHTTEDKIKTLKAAGEAGLEVCSGGIIGMGESVGDRLALAFLLEELKVPSIPINILHPIPGTPLEHTAIISDEDILRTIALFRLINKSAQLRFAGGRARLSPEVIDKALFAGINAAISGDLLTTLGSDVATDRERFSAYYELPALPDNSIQFRHLKD